MDQYSQDPFGALTGEDLAKQRNNARDSLFLIARLSVAGRDDEQVRVRNLSSGGLMAEYAAPIANGTRVEVDVRGIGVVPGRIAWATDGRIGIAFDQQIDPMLARKPVRASDDPRRVPYRG